MWKSIVKVKGCVDEESHSLGDQEGSQLERQDRAREQERNLKEEHKGCESQEEQGETEKVSQKRWQELEGPEEPGSEREGQQEQGGWDQARQNQEEQEREEQKKQDEEVKQMLAGQKKARCCKMELYLACQAFFPEEEDRIFQRHALERRQERLAWQKDEIEKQVPILTIRMEEIQNELLVVRKRKDCLGKDDCLGEIQHILKLEEEMQAIETKMSAYRDTDVQEIERQIEMLEISIREYRKAQLREWEAGMQCPRKQKHEGSVTDIYKAVQQVNKTEESVTRPAASPAPIVAAEKKVSETGESVTRPPKSPAPILVVEKKVDKTEESVIRPPKSPAPILVVEKKVDKTEESMTRAPKSPAPILGAEKKVDQTEESAKRAAKIPAPILAAKKNGSKDLCRTKSKSKEVVHHGGGGGLGKTDGEEDLMSKLKDRRDDEPSSVQPSKTTSSEDMNAGWERTADGDGAPQKCNVDPRNEQKPLNNQNVSPFDQQIPLNNQNVPPFDQQMLMMPKLHMVNQGRPLESSPTEDQPIAINAKELPTLPRGTGAPICLPDSIQQGNPCASDTAQEPTTVPSWLFTIFFCGRN